jgi:phage tail sheath protein FI
MPVTPTYPGVYIEELPSAVRTITGVSTSVTAFVGYTTRGPVSSPVTLTSFADFERGFGGLTPNSPLSYSVQQFYANGGSTAIVVRLASGAASAAHTVTGTGGDSFTVTAAEPGTWGDGLRVAVDPTTTDGLFDLRVFDLTGAVRETYQSVSVDSTNARFVTSVVDPSSPTISVAVPNSPSVPNFSGTVSGPIPAQLPDFANQSVAAAVAGGGSHDIVLYTQPETKPQNIGQLAVLLEAKIRAAAPSDPAFAAARVTVIGDRLRLLPGQPDATMTLIGTAASTLGLQASANSASYALTGGGDGSPPGDTDFIGSADAKTGLYALADAPDLNLLVIPELSAAGFDRIAVISQAIRLCEEKRAFFIVDSPAGWTSLAQARAGLAEFDSVRSDHAALYFPHIQLSDPLTGQLRSFPPSGAIAGIYASIDTARGVWKAPAGTEAVLSGVRALTVPLTDQENGLINPLGLNALRNFPVYGPVVWGARTLAGADQLTSQWKYVPVRRFALFLEESLYRGTKWVVFEPNDEPLWGQIRLNVGAFLNNLFLQGAFQGTSARDAYFVKCDRTTTTQDDVNRGVVNIVVGFAPLKPAEFVIIQIQQITGQIQV